jgi:hypothetical protein
MNTVNVCTNPGTVPTALTASPDGNRFFITCWDTVNTPQINNTLDVWDISLTSTGVPFVQSIALPASAGNNGGLGPTNSENGCTTPVDVKAKLTTSTLGTRLFVSCQDSDTVIPIDYDTRLGSGTLDTYSISATIVSTDATAITNATLLNTGTAYSTYACGNTGSCPQLLDLMPNPPVHITTGGYSPTPPFALPGWTSGTPYNNGSGYYVVAQGGAVPRTWSEPTGLLGSGACTGLLLDTVSGQIGGTPTTPGTCGGTTGFVIRVTDGAGQFVERAFTIPIS